MRQFCFYFVAEVCTFSVENGSLEIIMISNDYDYDYDYDYNKQ